VTDPRGFLTIERRVAGYRPVAERRDDWRDVNARPADDDVRTQARRCMDCGVPFCHSGCPLGNAIPEWNDLVERGRFRQALDALHATNNFPEFTGKLCPAPCEEACVLQLNDDAVTIKLVEQAIIDRGFDAGWVQPRPPAAESGRSVAVVGSGPAGLAAAQQLRRRGHAVTVYERDDRAGGLLRYGIPDFKLEKADIDRRLGQLSAEGVRFEMGAPVTDLDGLGADAVVLATGAQRHRDLAVPGRELPGVEFAMSYLTACNRRVAGLEARSLTAAGRRVVILGGGDTGADCLGAAIRERAASIALVGHGSEPPAARDPLRTWPEWPRLLRTYAAHLEGGERLFEFETVAFRGDGSVAALDGVRPDGSQATLEADLVLLAIGFSGIEADDPVYAGIDVAGTGAVAVDGRFATSRAGVFAAGDCVRGADLIVTAIADGRRCAAAVHAYLGTLQPVA
jgi:glutamate synthase (NADPH/NADH) small chain